MKQCYGPHSSDSAQGTWMQANLEVSPLMSQPLFSCTSGSFQEFWVAGCQSTAPSLEPNIWCGSLQHLPVCQATLACLLASLPLYNQILVSEICLGTAACCRHTLSGSSPGSLGISCHQRPLLSSTSHPSHEEQLWVP